ncbi:TetR/AcrR family transcriptional regulator [Actinomadura harenae]|uniref:TetR/AcrR family transcriptional regulator n=1 Tax=Actinomadura harenae TaxID=2483351 RepID=A0A3M2M178_9ACTN|nr:TetR/AcrR family transcriptional regulator [Actinomadura harenae]RMI43464.1 TetR/AcrR family transcriptional regulator [Actinomadura harenae]
MSPRTAAAVRDGDRSLRDHLVATAERLISERGMADLTVRAIARAAGVADGVLYNHFSDKDELLTEAWWAWVQDVERGLPALPVSGEGRLADGVRAHLEYGLAFHRAVVPALSGLLGRPEFLARIAAAHPPGEGWRDRLAAWLRAERDLGRVAASAPVDAIAAMMVGVCHETVLNHLLRGIPATPEPPSGVGPDELVKAVLPALTSPIA